LGFEQGGLADGRVGLYDGIALTQTEEIDNKKTKSTMNQTRRAGG